MEKPTLLVLAAGMGSRYGGLKQIDPVGPSGETIIDYSVYDAIRSGFGKLVFVIRPDIETAFKESIGRRFEDKLPVKYVFQELSKVPTGFQVPSGRTKPWGTGHAILMAAEAITGPFAVINADDFYGRDSYAALAKHFNSGSTDMAMVGFVLENTLSEFGTVSRGVCQTDASGYLQRVTELTNIQRDSTGVHYQDSQGNSHPLTGKEVVSLNTWGFTPKMFDWLRLQFKEFLNISGQDAKAEFYIPTAVSNLINSKAGRVKVLPTSSSWFGITYRDDRPRVVESIRNLVQAGAYPAKLWS